MTVMLTATSGSASAHASGRGRSYPAAPATLRLVASYPNGLTGEGDEQVLADEGRDVVMLLEYDAPSGGCLHDRLGEIDLATGKLRLGLLVTCYASLFRSGTGQVYMARPNHRGTDLLQVESEATLAEVATVGFGPASFRLGAPVPGTENIWLTLAGRIALFDLATSKVLRSLKLPSYVSGRPDGLALAEQSGPLYMTYFDPHRCRYFCAVLAEVNPVTGRVLVRRPLDHFTAWPVATARGVFVGLYNGGTGVVTNVYSASGLRLLSGKYGFGGTVNLYLTATGRVAWWSASPPGASAIYCGWITKQGSLGYMALHFKRWGFVWGNPVGIEPSTGDMLLAGTAATAKAGVYGLFAISVPGQCKAHM